MAFESSFNQLILEIELDSIKKIIKDNQAALVQVEAAITRLNNRVDQLVKQLETKNAI